MIKGAPTYEWFAAVCQQLHAKCLPQWISQVAHVLWDECQLTALHQACCVQGNQLLRSGRDPVGVGCLTVRVSVYN